MLFNLILNDQDGKGSMYLVSANTINDCFNYAIGTGKEIVQITKDLNTQLIVVQSSSTESFSVYLSDGSTSDGYAIFDSKDNVLTWVANQTGKQVQSIQYMERTFVNV